MNDESTPKGAHEIPATVSTASVPAPRPFVTDHDRDIPTLDNLSMRGREIASSYYESGYVAGIAAGCQQMFDAWHERAEVSAAVVASIANRKSFAALSLIRGEPERAAQQVARLIENGVVAA